MMVAHAIRGRAGATNVPPTAQLNGRFVRHRSRPVNLQLGQGLDWPPAWRCPTALRLMGRACGSSSSTSPVPHPPHRKSRVFTLIVSKCRSRMNMSRGLGCRASGVGLALWNSSPRPCGSGKAPRLPTLARVNASSGCQERGGGQWLSDRDPIFRTGPSSGPGVACSPQAFVDLRSG
jgi:hypothetical protein